MTSASLDSITLRRVLGHYPTGVCVVAAVEAGEGPSGMVVSSFTSVSLDPPLVAFFPDKLSSSWKRIEAAKKFCVNILAAEQQALCRQFATRGGYKFDGVAHRMSSNGSPVLDGVVAWIDCDLYAIHEAGDHHIAVGLVKDLAIETASNPLLFFRGNFGEFA